MSMKPGQYAVFAQGRPLMMFSDRASALSHARELLGCGLCSVFVAFVCDALDVSCVEVPRSLMALLSPPDEHESATTQ